jgi:hypothetical protein
MIGFVASTVSMTVTSIEMINFIASTISTKSSLSATSAFHGGGAGVLGGAGVTHTDPMDILIIPIHPTTPATDTGMVTMVMGRPAMIPDMTTRLGVTTAAITAAQTTEMTIPPIQEWPSCNADLRRLGITLALSMELWGLRPGKQFALSSATMGIEVVASSPAINYAKFYSRSHHAVIRVYDDAGNVIETHEHPGDFKEP